MIIARIFDESRNLMITETDDESKMLQKIGTDEVYESAVDLIEGYREEGGERIPYSRFEYEETEKPIAETLDIDDSEEV